MDSVLGKRGRGGDAVSKDAFSPKLPRASLAMTCGQIGERIKLITEAFLHTDTDEADEETLLLLSVYAKELELLTANLADSTRGGRLPYQVLTRNSWKTFRTEKEEAAGGLFRRTFRMSPDQFDDLFALVKGELAKDKSRHPTPNRPIEPEERLLIALRFIAGGQAVDLVNIAPVALNTVYHIVWSTMRVLIKCDALKFIFDIGEKACADRAADFAKRSSAPHIFCKVAGVMDGLFIRIAGRSRRESGNPRAFHSGHKHGFGLNLQVICDAYCRVLDASCNTPGCTNDSSAYRLSSFRKLVDALPDGFYVLADPAYPLSEKVLTSYVGQTPSSNFACQDDYNYFHSQIRITIERLFGQLVNKFGVLWQPMRFRLEHIMLVIQVVLRVHNFLINHDIQQGKAFLFRGRPDFGCPSDIQFGAPVAGVDPKGERLADARFATATEEAEAAALAGLAPAGEPQKKKRKSRKSTPGVSMRREFLRGKVQSAGLKRPDTSKARLAAKAAQGL